MNFELKHGLIWITFELIYEGNSVIIDKCILDTGSAATAIDIDLVDFNYRKPATVKRLFGIGGGTQEVISQNVGKVIIGGRELNDIEIEFGDIQAELGSNGFVGNDILSRFSILIDYQKREIQFKE
ncbi:MAG: hypothetical protein ABIF11_00075 [Nitrospirota bacterium]